MPVEFQSECDAEQHGDNQLPYHTAKTGIEICGYWLGNETINSSIMKNNAFSFKMTRSVCNICTPKLIKLVVHPKSLNEAFDSNDARMMYRLKQYSRIHYSDPLVVFRIDFFVLGNLTHSGYSDWGVVFSCCHRAWESLIFAIAEMRVWYKASIFTMLQ